MLRPSRNVIRTDAWSLHLHGGAHEVPWRQARPIFEGYLGQQEWPSLEGGDAVRLRRSAAYGILTWVGRHPEVRADVDAGVLARAATEARSAAAGPSLLALAIVGDDALDRADVRGALLAPNARLVWSAGALLAGRQLPANPGAVDPRRGLLAWRQQHGADSPLPVDLRAVLDTWRAELSLATDDNLGSTLRVALGLLFAPPESRVS